MTAAFSPAQRSQQHRIREMPSVQFAQQCARQRSLVGNAETVEIVFRANENYIAGTQVTELERSHTSKMSRTHYLHRVPLSARSISNCELRISTSFLNSALRTVTFRTSRFECRDSLTVSLRCCALCSPSKGSFLTTQ